ncbi:MAG: LysR family transcriptional regulator [Cyanobacteria bacterium P01_F01_bin.33]
MNWSDLQVVLAFQREGTLHKAAKKLGVDLSTVSRRIRSLEADLGTPLVKNISGRLVLTSQGEQAVRAAEAMEIESDRLHRIVMGQKSELCGSLRIALLDVFASFHADLIDSFKTRYPHVSLELVTSTSRVHNLTRREADIAIRVAKQPHDTLVGTRSLHLQFAIYAHRSIAEPSTDWTALPWVGWDPAMNARITDRWMEKHIPRDRIRIRVDSTATLFALANTGAGACILPTVYAIRYDTLVQLSGVLQGFDTYVWLLTHRDLKRNGRVQAFLEHFHSGLAPLRSHKDNA